MRFGKSVNRLRLGVATRNVALVAASALAGVLRALVFKEMGNTRLRGLAVLYRLTLAALHFLVASGFTLVLGLMRIVNLAHGSLFLMGGCFGYWAAAASSSWMIGLAVVALVAAAAGVFMQRSVLQQTPGQDLRQSFVSIVLADLFLWMGWRHHQIPAPAWLYGTPLHLVDKHPSLRLAVLAPYCAVRLGLRLLHNHTRLGKTIRASVDDRSRFLESCM